MSYIVSTSPHIKSEQDIATIMKMVCIALIPAVFISVLTYGWWALVILGMSIAGCLTGEAVCQRLRSKPITLHDWSAVVTGVLLAGVLPVNMSWWMPFLGGVFAMAIGKHAFGGLGNNIWNPALLARAFLGACFASLIFQSAWVELRQPADKLPAIGDTLSGPSAMLGKNPDIVSGATVLKQIQKPVVRKRIHSMKEMLGRKRARMMLKKSFLGVEGGCLLETSVLALLIGGLFLLAQKVITWEIPIPYILTVAVLGWVLPAPYVYQGQTFYTDWFTGPWMLHLVGGGLFIGAFFMATDMVTSPISFKGRLVFGIGCGVLTVIIRLYAGYPEGVCYSILIMNTCVPLIDAWTRPEKFGAVKPAPDAA